jgi:hypothetical protein
MGISDKINGISRRDLFRVAGRYGMSSTLLAASGFGGAMSLANLASAAESTYDKRFAKEAKFTLKFGAAGFNARNLLIERAGALEFARDLESRTDGEIRVEFIGEIRSVVRFLASKSVSRVLLISMLLPRRTLPVVHHT